MIRIFLSPPPLIAWEGRTCLFLREIGQVACIGAALADVETRFIVSKCFWFTDLWCEVFLLENLLHGKGWLVSSKLPDWNLFPPHLPDSLASLCISYQFTPIQIYFNTIHLYVFVKYIHRIYIFQIISTLIARFPGSPLHILPIHIHLNCFVFLSNISLLWACVRSILMPPNSHITIIPPSFQE